MPTKLKATRFTTTAFVKEIMIENGFKERKLTSQPVEDFSLAITKVWMDPTFHWEGGESNIIAQKRGATAALAVLEKYEGKNIVIGTHGNIMVLTMNYFDQKYNFSFWENLEMPDVYKLTFVNKQLKKVEHLWGR